MIYKGQNSRQLFDKGKKLRAEGKYPESIEVFTRLIQENSEFGEAYFERAVCYYKLGSYINAENDLQAAAVLGCEEALFWSR